MLAVGGVTLVCSRVMHVNTTTVGFAYLLTVLILAAEWGLAEAVVASVAATLSFNFFFLPPKGTFTIIETSNWVALCAFLVTSLIASQLSERAKRRTLEVASRKTEVERLYDLSRAILLTDANTPMAGQIADQIARIYQAHFVAIRHAGSQIHVSGSGYPESLDADLSAAAQGTPQRHDGWILVPIVLGTESLGSLAVGGATLSAEAFRALANLVAIALEKEHAQELANRAEAARESQEFKSVLLDALAHEFKTPLTSVKAAITAILSSGVSSPAEQRTLCHIIDQEADRLGSLVTETLHLARIEAGKVELRLELCDPRTLVDETLRQMASSLDGHSLKVTIEADLPALMVDIELMRLVLRQLLANALKYSPAGSDVHLAAAAGERQVTIAIHNEGQGFSQSEASRIFDWFYRGAAARGVPGTGMGLAIAREIVTAHGGEIRAQSIPGQGAEFVVSIPVVSENARE